MFENLGWMEIACLALVGLFILGPERLPKVIGDAARMLRKVRAMARNATSELQTELGTDIDITDLNPRSFVRKHLLSDEDVDMLSAPLKDAFKDVQDVADGASGNWTDLASDPLPLDKPDRLSLRKGSATTPSLEKSAPYDFDAT